MHSYNEPIDKEDNEGAFSGGAAAWSRRGAAVC